ncbi:unnamed protein product [Arctia plantaginis]|uniref:Mediator of RNA polymerase II transcription subunit 16 n=1 Tax=Arctia plantaginis TaxID=874455 RepID=A0A8S1AAT5_ARCPL|nr:unnamed protein product [Arctia plantaginis]
MELLYSMRRKPLKCEPPHFESPSDYDVIRPICTISNANIIAFSSPTELTDSEGDTWGGHVYVCDLDTPWDSHKVTSTSYPVSALEWDLEGKQLLVATTVGSVSVFTQKDYLLNEWLCLYTANFSGEHVIRSIFFHNGRRVVAVDKKPDAPITERIQLLRSTPTLKGFGGSPLEGALIITATGLIGALTPPSSTSSDINQAQVSTDCLRPTRDHITTASIAHKNGSLIIAAVSRSGGSRCCVVCALCSVATAAPSPQIKISPLPTIYLPHQYVASSVSISWWHREDPDSLLVAGSTLSLWKCTERSHQVHKLFSKGPLQGSTTPGGGLQSGADCFNTLVWQSVSAWAAEAGRVCCARAAVGAGAGGGAPHAVLAAPRALHLVARDSAHILCSRPVITSGGVGSSLAEVTTTPPKKPKYGPGVTSGGGGAVVSCVEMSQLGGVVVAIDTYAQLHVYKLPQPWADIPTPLAVQQATSLLEYAMVSGVDCLDVLLTLKHSVGELVYERFTETFQRQPPTFQQYYFHSWLKLRIALCRLSPGAASSVSWLTCLQSLQAAWACVCGALRADDKPDSAPLAALLDDHSHDHDKSLLALETKCDTIPEAASLAPLRLLLQRALDIALTAMLSLCHHQHQHLMHHFYEVWADSAAVALLRRLASAARLGGRAAEPLLRPLARLAASAAPKPDLIEECAALTAQWTGARVWEALPRCSVAAPHDRLWPLYLEYGVEPEALRFIPEPPPYAQCETTPSITMDSIRYMYLGGGSRPARWRQCARCGARALPAAQPARHPLQRACDARFLPACRCGGKWTLFSNI